MKNEKEKWMEEVFQSMKGSQRAKPSAELFAHIQNRIANPEAKPVPMYQWKSALAAAAVILLINITALFYYSQQEGLFYENTSVTDAYHESFISTYQIYE